MKHKFIHIICFTLLVAGLTACTSGNKKLRSKGTPSITYWILPTLPTPCTVATAGSQTPVHGWASPCPKRHNG